MRYPRLFLPRLISVAFCFLFVLPAPAETPELSGHFETETEWPGIYFQVIRADRIIQNRLMVVVRIQATGKTPASGIFLGGDPPPPPFSHKPTVPSTARYGPQLFSLASSIMKEEQSGVQYPVLPTVEPPGKSYFLSGTLAALQPGKSVLLSIQFAVPPPPPPPPPGQEARPQTVSFLLPKAKGPIMHVPLPPPNSAKVP